jgi:ElaB/YqjD/DUF883 family membrane-anchored ribosome-binding protein
LAENEDRKILIEILQRVTKVETKVDEMTNAKDIAQEALHSTQSAHHRIDELKTDRIAKIESNQTWLWRTAITGLISGLVAAVGLIIGFLSNHK